MSMWLPPGKHSRKRRTTVDERDVHPERRRPMGGDWLGLCWPGSGPRFFLFAGLALRPDCTVLCLARKRVSYETQRLAIFAVPYFLEKFTSAMLRADLTHVLERAVSACWQ